MSRERMEIEAVSVEEEEEYGTGDKKKETMEVEVNEKGGTEHVEYSSKPVLKKYYWDTKDVVGADRHMGPDTPFTQQDEVVVRRGFFKRKWLHYKRYWMLYTPALIVLAAGGLTILFLVIFPAIAQRLVDNASLPIHWASIMSPTPDSIVYSMEASLSVPAGVTVDLKPMNLSLYTAETGSKNPYVEVSLPEYHLKGNSNITIVNQTATIMNQTEFIQFLTSAVTSENFTLSASGGTVAYLGILKAKIELTKNVELAGLAKLNGFAFASAAVVLPAEADGTNLKGTVVLPNPSIVTFELGNVTLNMIVGGLVVGSGRLYNVVLEPGNNTLPIQATVDLKTVFANLPAILLSQATALKSGNIQVSASGNSTIYNGQHIPYYEQVLNSLTVTGEMPIVQLLIDSASSFLSSSNLTSTLAGAISSSNLTSILAGLAGNSSLTGNSTSLSSLLSGL